MVQAVQHVRHTTANSDLYLGKSGEFTYDIERDEIRTHDGSTTGGHSVMRADASNATVSLGTLPTNDTQTLVRDPSDTSKLMRIDVGSVATATTRVLFMPDSDVNLGSDFATAAHTHTGVYQPLDAVLTATTASFLTTDETKLDAIENNATADQTASEILTLLLTVDGAGSGLDADLLDGNSSAAFALAAHNHSGVYEPADGTLLKDADIGSTVQAYDATLLSLASLGTAADKLIYTTGVDTWAESAITAAGRAILDDADATAQLATLGTGNFATANYIDSADVLLAFNGFKKLTAAEYTTELAGGLLANTFYFVV